MMTESAIVDRLSEIFSVPKWTQIIDSLRPDDILTIDISNQILGDIFLENEEGFKELAKQAVLRIKQERMGEISS